MTLHQDSAANGWLAFELSVLRRLKFGSVALPFTGEPDLGLYLKRFGTRVTANDTAQWSWTKATAYIENNNERPTEADIEAILEDAYVPRYRLNNPSLRTWFSETDAWWFDNVRENILRQESNLKRALAFSLGMMVGDYVLSFDETTRELRQPLSRVYRHLWQTQTAPVDNRQQNHCTLKEPREFIAERKHTELLFLRLPQTKMREQRRQSLAAWREEWLHGEDNFWDETDRASAGRLGGHVQTKGQYLRLVEELLQSATHIPAWAIAHAADGFISTTELVEAISRVRRVETIYTKDFSELTGKRAAIITAR